jgi:alpha-beta hydrolase superfamily lysophospholipase
VHRLMSLRLGISLIQSGQWAIDQAAELHFPTLLMHGAEDQLTSPAGSREFAEASDQTCFKIWDNLQHDLHFEPEWKTVLGFLRGWMAGQVEDQLFSPSLVA